MLAALSILAQNDGFNISDLLYLLIFLIFPALNSLGEWIRKKWGKDETAGADDGETVYEVTVTEDNELVLQPASRPEKSTPTTAVAVPTRPEATTGRGTAPSPVARPASPPPRKPQAPQPKRPEPTRSHPSARQARPARQTRGQAPKPQPVIETYNAFDTEAFVVEAELIEEHEPLRSARDLLGGEKLDANSLRKAVILAEILSPPLATRDASSTPFARPE